MSKKSHFVLASLSLLLLPLTGSAQSMSDIQDLSPEDRRAYFEAISPEEREAKRAELRAEIESMSDEDRAALRERRKSEHAERRAQWENMSDEERAAKREQMQQRHGERRGHRGNGGPHGE